MRAALHPQHTPSQGQEGVVVREGLHGCARVIALRLPRGQVSAALAELAIGSVHGVVVDNSCIHTRCGVALLPPTIGAGAADHMVGVELIGVALKLVADAERRVHIRIHVIVVDIVTVKLGRGGGEG